MHICKCQRDGGRASKAQRTTGAAHQPHWPLVERETPSSRYEDSVHCKACSELLGGDLALGLETSRDVREVREKDAVNTDSTRVKDFWGKKKKNLLKIL